MNKNVTLEESKKRFQQILEFTYHGRGKHVMGEAGEDQQDPNATPMQGADADAMPPASGVDAGGTPPMDGGAGNTPMQGADAGTMPPAGGADAGGIPPMDGGADAGGSQQTPQGFNPQDMGGGMEGGDITPADFEGGANPDDDIIDVSELTDAQEETKDEVEKFSDKFEQVFKVLGQWEELIKSNNEKIEDLKAEFEKRNPTQVEKLSMQTAKSGPFNVKPEDYWNEKEATSNYSTEPDNNGKEQGQYVITKDDVEGTTDWKAIADSISDDALYHPTLKNTMGNW
jgi:hypothetical protein